ncbi:MAG: hypothetical protein WD381_05350 [Balneolaceae bacterium]
MIRFFFCVVVLLTALSIQQASAQEQSGLLPIPNVYLDCNSCDVTYIRSNITFVNYVRDQDDASIYLTISDQRTGGGGVEYRLHFNGMGHFEGQSDTLRYVSASTDSGDERRIGLNRHIKIGLIPFVSQTMALGNLDIFYEEPEIVEEDESDDDEDPWHGWIYDLNLSSNMNGEDTETNFGLYSGFEAELTTATWKIRERVRGEIRRRTVELTDETLDINRDWGDYWGMVGYSLSKRSTVALFSSARFSKTDNIALATYLAPAIEYNFYPYEEFQQRRFIVQYQLTPTYRRYYNTTIFLEDAEFIMSHEVSTRLRYDQSWGRIDIRASAMHFFHDLDINRIEINPSFNIRIIRGLSVSLSGRYRIINDQLSLELPGDVDPNDPESIIRGVQRPTSFDYSISFGLSYTFGSIYNNVVNSRF